MAKGKKTGGRQKGTPNKTTSRMRDVLASAITDYFNPENARSSEELMDIAKNGGTPPEPNFFTDLRLLSAKDRVPAMEKFCAYIMPKLQSTSLDITAESTQTIEDKLRELAGEDNE